MDAGAGDGAASSDSLHSCVLCHTGSETEPLGLVAQLQVTVLPVHATADPASPLTPEHPGLPAAAVDGSRVFPSPGAGPRLSVFDRQPSLRLLCCGHILHATCLESYRSAVMGLGGGWCCLDLLPFALFDQCCLEPPLLAAAGQAGANAQLLASL
jgi:hypothetical protein